jgi:hypothetical protein
LAWIRRVGVLDMRAEPDQCETRVIDRREPEGAARAAKRGGE